VTSKADVETFLYAAFLSEALSAFSQKIASRVPEGRPVPEASGGLREEFLRFQDEGLPGRGESPFLAGGASSRGSPKILRLPEHYLEVQSELDRLHELEQQLAAERRQATDRALSRVLFVVAVVGFLQTILGFLNWKGTSTQKTELVVAVVAAAGFLLFLRQGIEGPHQAQDRG